MRFIQIATLFVCLLFPAISFGDIVADSIADFSGNQGENNWAYGLYNQTTDSDATYSADDFELFQEPDYAWNGSAWDFTGGDVPWTTVGGNSGHPNGDNNGDVHYAIRRWASDASGTGTVTYNLAKTSSTCIGNGTSAILYQNGAELSRIAVAGGDIVGTATSQPITLAVGDLLDLALSPQGPDGSYADGCDGSLFGMTVDVQAAAVGPRSISINFGADEPSGARSDVTGAAGVLGNSNWNNLDLLSGTAANLIGSDGAATGASVEWVSANTWASAGRGEENNTAPAGNDKNLMTGYLDTAGLGGQGVELTVNGLNGSVGSAYDVYVYAQGGVIGRGGDYVIGSTTKSNGGVAAFSGTYVEGTDGNYLLFSGVTGDSFSLTTIPNIGATARAPVNGIEIVGVPEPTSMVLTLVGLLGLLRLRRK